jgi:hypothetical protein
VLYLQGNKTLVSSDLVARICLTTVVYGETTKQRPINNSSAVADKLDRGSAMQEALFAVRREARTRYELGKSKILLTLKKTTCSSETSVLTRATRYEVSEDTFN